MRRKVPRVGKWAEEQGLGADVASGWEMCPRQFPTWEAALEAKCLDQMLAPPRAPCPTPRIPRRSGF